LKIRDSQKYKNTKPWNTDSCGFSQFIYRYECFLTDVVGSVIAADIDTWFLEYSLFGTDNWVQIATGTDEFTNQSIATFDPTLLANDNYDLRLSATDSSGNIERTTIFVGVEGQAKLGNIHVTVHLLFRTSGIHFL